MMTADQAIGAKVNELLFRNRRTRKQLGAYLGITGTAISNKVYGNSKWSMDDLFATADFFGIDITDLLPRKASTQQETPDPLSRTEGSTLVAGAGFEPTTSGL